MEKVRRRGGWNLQRALTEAINHGNDEEVAKLLSESDARDVKEALSCPHYTETQWTPLMNAAKSGYCKIVELLLAKGATVDDAVGAVTPLMAACMSAPPKYAADVASLLLAANADPNLIDRYRETCLIKAAGRGVTDLIDVLLNAKADVNVRNNQDHTALYYAAKGGHEDAVRRLLQAGPDEEARRDAVCVAEEKELTEIMSILGKPAEPKVKTENVDAATPRKNVFATSVLAELPTGDGRVGFRKDVHLLLSGVGQSYYSSALSAAGFGIAQLILAGDKELLAAGVRFAPQRRAIMGGMMRLSLHPWGEGTLPPATSSISVVHAACTAVRQIHIMWATAALARLRLDPNLKDKLDLDGSAASEARTVTRTAIRYTEQIKQRAEAIAAMAKAKISADPASPADLISQD